MPHPGEQHRENATTANPFAENRPSLSTYTAQEIATLSSRLDKQLGPEYISTRSGPGGGKLHYIAADKVIQLANEVFGFNGWSSQIQNVQVDFVDENATTGKITLGLSTIVRVTLRDGTFHEDIGYGHIENCKGKAAAFEKAKKEATTDALKRALRNFGNVLGNCLYDKDYLSRVSKIKPLPSRWDTDRLYRHQDHAPIKTETAETSIRQPAPALLMAPDTSLSASFGSGEFDEEFGGDPFDESDFVHPDDARLDEPRAFHAPPARNSHQGNPVRTTAPHGAAYRGPQQPQQPQQNATVTREAPVKAVPGPINRAPPAPNGDGNKPVHSNTSGRAGFEQPMRGNDPDMAAPMEVPPDAPQGFISGRSVDTTGAAEAKPSSGAVAFNPYSESPSIRRTLVAGLATGKSAPIKRSQLEGGGVLPSVSAAPGQPTGAANGSSMLQPQGGGTPVRTNYVNPSADTGRRIGMPGVPGTTPNRGQYRPPSAIGVKRPPLTDMTNHQHTDSGGDAKKPKVEGNGHGPVSEMV